MTRTKIIIAIVTLFAIATSQGEAGDTHKERGTGPTSSGRQGGANVFSAEPVEKGTFGFGYQKEYFESKTIPFEGRNHVHGGQVFLNYAPFDFLGLFVNQKTISVNNEDLFPILQSHSFSKSEAGATILFPLSDSAFLGVEGNYALFNGNGIEDIDKAGSWGARLLHTWKTDILKRKYPLKFHFNTLYFKDRSHRITDGSAFETLRLLGISRFDTLQYGLGIEVETSSLSPFVEYTLDHTLDSGIPIFRNSNRLTTGFKITPTDAPWQIHIGHEFGFVALTPKSNFFAGVSYQTPNAVIPAPRLRRGQAPAGITVKAKEEAIQESQSAEAFLDDDLPLTIVPLSEEEMKQYPIYLIEKTSAEKTPEVKKIKRIKKQQIKKEIIEEKIETLSEPEQIPEKKDAAVSKQPELKELRSSPSIQEKSQTGSADPSDTALKEIFKSREDPEKGYEEETPNKNFLIHFR